MDEFKKVFAMRFWCDMFTSPSPTPSLMPSAVPGSARDLGLELRGAPSSTTSRPQLRSVH